jgi:hypothetical protein
MDTLKVKILVLDLVGLYIYKHEHTTEGMYQENVPLHCNLNMPNFIQHINVSVRL